VILLSYHSQKHFCYCFSSCAQVELFYVLISENNTGTDTACLRYTGSIVSKWQLQSTDRLSSKLSRFRQQMLHVVGAYEQWVTWSWLSQRTNWQLQLTTTHNRSAPL